MQRLFSMFPAGRAGAALLLMRLALAAAHVDGGWSRLHAGSDWAPAAAIVIALALCVGILVPIACALSVLLDLAVWASSVGENDVGHLCAVLGAIALFMLGPGAYSLDAKLFGRRRVVIDSRRDRRRD